jgi:hypothetical protein
MSLPAGVMDDLELHLERGRPEHDQQHCYHHALTVKPEAATAVVELLMMGVRTPKTCSAVHKRQVIKLRNCCIWLVDLFETAIWSWLMQKPAFKSSSTTETLLHHFHTLQQ